MYYITNQTKEESDQPAEEINHKITRLLWQEKTQIDSFSH